MGYQTSGSPKGGPFCFAGCPLLALIPAVASDKWLRGSEIPSQGYSSHHRLSDKAVENPPDSAAGETIPGSLNLIFASARCQEQAAARYLT